MKIAISGSYSVGKTTTALALSYLTGIHMTNARTMREILPVAFPNKRLEKCLPHELFELGMRRFIERVQAESKLGSSFISDGTPLQEWIYGMARLDVGMNPSEPIWKNRIKKVINYSRWRVFKETIEMHGTIVRRYTRNNYDVFIHLPIEFPFVRDGHRPISEKFRLKSDETIRNIYRDLGTNVLEVKGSLEERLDMITAKLNLKQVITIHEAISLALEHVKIKFNNIKLELS